MKFKSFSAHILALLGLSEWSKVEDKNSITVEEVAKLKNYGFTEKFLTDFKASLENDFQDESEDGNQGEETEEPKTTAFLRGFGRCVFAAQHGALAALAARLAIERVGDRVKDRRLAGTRVAGDEVEPGRAEHGKVHGRSPGVRAEGGHGQVQRSHGCAS